MQLPWSWTRFDACAYLGYAHFKVSGWGFRRANCAALLLRIVSASTVVFGVLRTLRKDDRGGALNYCIWGIIRERHYPLWYGRADSADNLKSAQGNLVRVRPPLALLFSVSFRIFAIFPIATADERPLQARGASRIPTEVLRTWRWGCRTRSCGPVGKVLRIQWTSTWPRKGQR
jgi:hypothetical protein